MGTWGVKINDNDTFQDVYQNFFDLYNQGGTPVNISKQILKDFAEIFADNEDRNNGLFGLALAQWETKSLDISIFKEVKDIIETGRDFNNWKQSGADEKTLQTRRKELEKFLQRLSTEKERPKRRVRSKFEYSYIELLNLPDPNGQKVFGIRESYVNGGYQSTSAGLFWNTGGGSVFYFYEKGKFITADWVDSQTLEIHHDKTIVFAQKNETFYFCGDQGIIRYIPQ